MFIEPEHTGEHDRKGCKTDGAGESNEVKISALTSFRSSEQHGDSHDKKHSYEDKLDRKGIEVAVF